MRIMNDGATKAGKKKPIFLLSIILLALGVLFADVYHSIRNKLDQAGVSVSPDLEDNSELYRTDKDGTVLYLYVTVKDGGEYTLADVNNDRYDSDEFEAAVEVLFQEGSVNGPHSGYFGYGIHMANATMEIRGATARFAEQKSYKIRLNRAMRPWNGLWTINLNKHPWDLARIRNKLSFDYMEIIPHITSLRTQFVNLWVKDLSANPEARDFVDYGLFTMVEQPNNLFLQTRGFDTEGHLYKAEFFEFHRYPEILKNRDHPDYDERRFRQILDIRGNEDHGKLLAMLDDINNYSLNINEVIARHFNRNNYLTWLAVNILLENIDTRTQNFFLYSPSNSRTWYFLPWDYDATFDWSNQLGANGAERRAAWEKGLSNYWGVVLHRRFFQDPDNVQDLIDKMEQLLKIITPEQTTAFLNSYYPVVSQFTSRPPDSTHMAAEYWEKEYWRIVGDPNNNFNEFIQSMQNPMPVFLGIPAEKDGKILFNWDRSFDLQGDALKYDFQISDSPDFSNVIIEFTGLTRTKISIDPLPAGKYFWRVIIRDAQGNRQTAFDVLHKDGVRYNGVRAFSLK